MNPSPTLSYATLFQCQLPDGDFVIIEGVDMAATECVYFLKRDLDMHGVPYRKEADIESDAAVERALAKHQHLSNIPIEAVACEDVRCPVQKLL